ncbi:hypothetical protein [Tunturiibacter gelidiferens]|uniref:hypothetical protein n=1 Tax=Tunturiibacter gelidiferens TaxID=3069689 RepID=UPI003D9BDD06
MRKNVCRNVAKLAALVFLGLLVLPLAAFAQTAALTGYCNHGGTQASVSGMKSTNFQQTIIPSCTVTVFLTGTQTKATLFADTNGTPLSNPFTANASSSLTSGQWTFWVAVNQGYDVVGSGGVAPNTYSSPVPLVTGGFPGFQFSGGGVAQIIAGTGVTLSPTDGLGTVTINSTGGGGGPFPLTDTFITGAGNNGIPNFFASSSCNALSCAAGTPSTSTDTSIGINQAGNSTTNSSALFDFRYNAFGMYNTNPLPSGFGFNFVIQSGFPAETAYTTGSKSAIQGAEQDMRFEQALFINPGYVTSGEGCPFNCPSAGYTSTAQWQIQNVLTQNNFFPGAGVRGIWGQTNNFTGIGDASVMHFNNLYAGVQSQLPTKVYTDLESRTSQHQQIGKEQLPLLLILATLSPIRRPRQILRASDGT